MSKAGQMDTVTDVLYLTPIGCLRHHHASATSESALFTVETFAVGVIHSCLREKIFQQNVFHQDR